MGMDVSGKAPTSETGAYFRRSAWGWRPLAAFAIAAAPEITGSCTYWHSNEGDGLDADGSKALAVRLTEALESGEARDWIALRDAELARLPDVTCPQCSGTGVRRDAIGVSMGWATAVAAAQDSDGRPNPRAGQVGSCNGCNGRGSRRPTATYYCLDEDDVRQFAAFLADCGGFEIW